MNLNETFKIGMWFCFTAGMVHQYGWFAGGAFLFVAYALVRWAADDK